MNLKRRFVSLLCVAAILMSAVGCKDTKNNSSVASTGKADSSMAESGYGDSSDVLLSSDSNSSGNDTSTGGTSSKKNPSGGSNGDKTSSTGGTSSSGGSSGGGSTNKVPTYPVVKEDAKLLNDAVAAWDFTDGGTSGNVKSAISSGKAGSHKWGVWLRDSTFGMVLDFSTEGSYFKASPNIQLGNNFTIAAWVKAPIRESGKRVIMAQGTDSNGWQLYFDKDTLKLCFKATGLSGSTDSGVLLKDGKWHHIMVTYSGGKLTYYVDKVSKKTCSVSGSVPKFTTDLYIGSDTVGANGLDGSVARARIYNKAKTPADVTSITPPNSANEMTTTVLKMKKGIVVDRRQYASATPPENERVYAEDVTNCINMGFDHMKVLLTPNHIINASDGSLIEENMRYITRVVDDVVEQGMPCLLCIHPEVPFKQTYLTEGAEFEKMIKFYGELAAYIGEHWRADQVALQLMTEPYDNKPETRWTWMSDRMWGAVRNVLPDHTIVTSSDRSGNIERLKLMSPATDSNLIYSFTTYEPYTVGFATARTQMGGSESFWDYLEDIPYPVTSALNSSKIESIIRNVPDKWKSEARKTLQAYANGTYDADPTFVNNYDTSYGADWQMQRMKSLDDWSKKYGGNIHIQCVEFGCMDSLTAKTLFKAKGSGVSDATRIQMIGDLRRAFEKYNIGWSYWSYNESFTVFKPDKRTVNFSPVPEEAAEWFDYDLLENALGVTPKIKK